MSEQHTQGRIQAVDVNGDGCMGLISGKRDSMLTVDECNFAYVYNAEDARRLAACWNACETYSTEQIESWRKVVMDTKGEPIVAFVIGVGKDQARRLASCWKACDGLTQDHFDGGWTALGLSKHAKAQEDANIALRKELAAARALLADILR